MSMSGGSIPDWLYDIIIDIFEPEIESALDSTLSSAISSAVSTLANSALQQLPVTEEVYPNVQIDFAMVTNPIFNSGLFLETEHVGEFQEMNNTLTPPFSPSDLPDPVPSRMLQILVGDYVANTALFVFYAEGLINDQLYPPDIPDWFPYKLNTSSFCLFVDDLCKDYPDAPMMLNVYATSLPSFNFTNSGADLNMIGNADFYVIDANNTNTPVFGLSIQALANGTAMIVNGSSLAGELGYVHSVITANSSEVGTVRAGLMQTVVDDLLSKLVIPYLNKIIGKGFPLPTIDGLGFSDPDISIATNCIVIQTDVTYTPSPKLRQQSIWR